MGRVVVQRMGSEQPGFLASDGRSLFAGDTSCGCVVEWRDSRFIRSSGAGSLRQLTPIAIEGRHVYALDAFDLRVSFLYNGDAEARTLDEFAVLALESIEVSAGMFYLDTGAGRRIWIYSIRGCC